MRFAVMGPGLMSKRQKEARKRQSFPGGLAADLSQASGVAKKAAAPKQKAKGKKAKKARQENYRSIGQEIREGGRAVRPPPPLSSANP